MKTINLAAMAAVLALGLAQPVFAQTGDSKSDTRNRAPGVADNPNTSQNPGTGAPASTKGIKGSDRAAAKSDKAAMKDNRCDGLKGKDRDDCLARERSAKGSAAKGGKGVSDNPNTSQNPNTGGAQANRGGDSNLKAATGASTTTGTSTTAGASAKGGKGLSDNPNTSQNPGTGGSQMNRGGDSKNK